MVFQCSSGFKITVLIMLFDLSLLEDIKKCFLANPKSENNIVLGNHMF